MFLCFLKCFCVFLPPPHTLSPKPPPTTHLWCVFLCSAGLPSAGPPSAGPPKISLFSSTDLEKWCPQGGRKTEGWRTQNFDSFSLFVANFVLSSLSGVFSLNCGGGSRPCPPKERVWAPWGLLVKLRRPFGPQGLAHNDPRESPTGTLGWFTAENGGHNSTRTTPRKKRKNGTCGGREEKQRDILGGLEEGRPSEGGWEGRGGEPSERGGPAEGLGRRRSVPTVLTFFFQVHLATVRLA